MMIAAGMKLRRYETRSQLGEAVWGGVWLARYNARFTMSH